MNSEHLPKALSHIEKKLLDSEYFSLVASLRREVAQLKCAGNNREAVLADLKDKERQLKEALDAARDSVKDNLDKNTRILLDRQKKAYQILVAKLRREVRRLKFQRNSLADPLIEVKYFPYLPRTPFGTSARKPPLGIIGNLPPRSADYFALNPPPPTGNHPDSGNRWWWGGGPNLSSHLPPPRPKTAPSSTAPVPPGHIRTARKMRPQTQPEAATLQTLHHPTPPSLPPKLVPLHRFPYAKAENSVPKQNDSPTTAVEGDPQFIDQEIGGMPRKHNQAHSPSVGDHICVVIKGEKSTGTLQYLGEFDAYPSSGLWAGIRLDQKVGKHDGVVRGKRYFSCENGYGLFVKAEKVIPLQQV
ncbi:hypothetical protein BJ742DRAFT_844350 [Cladochytrium replicatum]|nr:hypothetical protein BJ742DRAFT_844350 [Cladochytrium replicatum]